MWIKLKKDLSIQIWNNSIYYGEYYCAIFFNFKYIDYNTNSYYWYYKSSSSIYTIKSYFICG